MTRSRTAVLQAVRTMGDRQPAFRPGNSKVKKTTLLVQVTFQLGSAMRQQTLFQAEQKNLRKLEPFCCVKGDEGHSIGALFGLFLPFPLPRGLRQRSR